MEQLVRWTNANERHTKAAMLFAAPATLAAAVLLRRWLRNRQLPPGPCGVPLLGCLRLRDQNQWHHSLTEIAQHYDGIFSFYIGSQLVIVVTSYSLIKEMLEDEMFSGRDIGMNKIQNNTGIAFTEGEIWTHNRRMGLRILRDFGFARPRSVEILDIAMQTVFEEIDAACKSNQPMKIVESVLGVSNSVIAQLLFGRLFTRQDPEFAKFCDTMRAMFSSPQISPLLQYPILRVVDKVIGVNQKMADTWQELRDYIKDRVREREVAMINETTEPTCLCDVYIQERLKAEKNGDLETYKYKEEQVVSVCVEFFAGGTESAARSLEWLLLFTAFDPEVQKRVHDELDEVVGQSRVPRLSDKTELHYVNAVIEEGYRKASLSNVGTLHRALQDTTFRGYRIPQDARIIAYPYTVHHDPQYWHNPHQFCPDRFLDDKGRFKSSPRVIPFLVGKRSCPGESLARMEVFLMFTMLMQRYSMRPTADSVHRKEEIIKGIGGITRIPNKWEAIFSRR